MSKVKIYDPHFSERMKFILETKFGNNNSEFARSVGVAVTSLNRWVIGEADPSRTNLVKIAEVAEVSLEWLATGQSDEEADIFNVLPKPLSKSEKLRQAIEVLQELLKTQETAVKQQEAELKWTKQELELIHYFRQCNEQLKVAALYSVKGIAEQAQKEQKESELPLEVRKVA